jgi:diguanylate cyclase (GGDEF)-like protein
MQGNPFSRSDRPTLIAYGLWVLFSLLLVSGTIGSLYSVERTQVAAVRGRAEAGAAAVEQAVLREFDGLQAIRYMARLRLQSVQPQAGEDRQNLNRQMDAVVASHRYEIQSVTVWKDAAPVYTSIPGSRPADAHDLVRADDVGAQAPVNGAAGDAPHLNMPVFEPAVGRWAMRTVWPVTGDGRLLGSLILVLDPVALSAAMTQLGSGDGMTSTVQRRSDGAVLAYSPRPASELGKHDPAMDEAFTAALSRTSGSIEERGGLHLTGFRAPPDLPIVVSLRFDTDTELAGFYRLRRIVLTVVIALVAGAFTATRLILTNYLLRARLGEQAMVDPLTGLYNRRFFTDVMSARFAQARLQGLSAAVLLIDLDGFKQINDTRGHQTGDALLMQVAARLRLACGPDDLVMRLGGDEFAIVRLCRQQRRDATSLARYIVGELSHVVVVEGYHLRISASVGVSLFPAGGETLGDMLRTADIALYFVKADGGDAYRIFDPAMEETVQTRRALEVDLRDALSRNQLEVYYQPLVQLEPRRVSGFEALLRWHHPVLGLIMPHRFIPVAEETGLIASIGEWVLRQACEQAAAWPANTRLAVNLSPVQFERSDMVDIVASALRDSRLAPGRLELEITEGVVMRDVGDVLTTMRRLRSLGVRLALDDFGTGYSSLSYLRSFPFDKVKIDASFLADLHGDGGTIIRAVLGLCGHLRLDSLVEGVETEDQLSWLRDEGCTEVQGHLFSPPRQASGVAEMIANVAARIPASFVRSYADL